jgi:signal transduction histidine kinase
VVDSRHGRESAADRDAAAEDRDRAAEKRDREAENDAVVGQEHNRQGSADDRRESSRDRVRAASDRHAADAERRTLEAQLLQSQRIEAVGQLASGVAHDFNNLLNVIDAYSALAQTELERDASFVAEALEEIRSACASAAALTSKLLAFSRTQPLHTTVADLNAIVSSALDLVAPLIGEGIVVHRQLDPAFIGARVDLAHVEQVIVNLAVNARDAMSGGGNLWVSTHSVGLDEDSISGLEPGRYASVTVRDDGAGMDAQTLTQIFEPFFTTKSVGEGTGLGLSTALRTIGQAGGRLEATSTPGEGSTFTIYLPRAEPPVAPRTTVEPAPIASRRGGERILLVEDEGSLRQLFARILVSDGYDVVKAGSHDEALRECSGRRFDLMITDGVRPGDDDVALAQAAALHQPDMAVLYISGYKRDRVSGLEIEAGNAAVLPKPFSAGQLTERVHELLDRSA